MAVPEPRRYRTVISRTIAGSNSLRVVIPSAISHMLGASPGVAVLWEYDPIRRVALVQIEGQSHRSRLAIQAQRDGISAAEFDMRWEEFLKTRPLSTKKSRRRRKSHGGEERR